MPDRNVLAPPIMLPRHR